MSVRRIDVGPRMSQAVVHGNTLYGRCNFRRHVESDLGLFQEILGARA